MTHILVFNLVLFGACLYALAAGGAPERWTAAVFLGGALMTFLLPFQPNVSYHTVHLRILAVDCLVLLGLVGIALRADRFWPLYVSALHLLTIAIHGVKALDPTLVPWMYAGASAKIAYPMLVLLALGVIRHRHRLALFGSDRDWSPLHAIDGEPR